MIAAIKTNPLAMWLTGAVAGFIAFGFVFDGISYSAFMSALLIVSGSMMLAATAAEAWDAVKEGQVTVANLAVLGIFLTVFGLVYSGFFGLIYNFNGRPLAWIGPWSSFGRFLTSIGVFLMFLSPAAVRRAMPIPSWWVVFVGLVLVGLLAFLFGASVDTGTFLTG